jgi:hypothetical protein
MTFTAEEVSAAPRRKRRTGNSRETRPQHRAAPKDKHSPQVDQAMDDSVPASDPTSSSTGAISRVAAPANGHRIDEDEMRRIRAEFLEMPGLCLTTDQARRLWGLERRTCEALLASLIESRFLHRTSGGLFALFRPGG